jgi:hypothetical protein
MKKLFLFLLLLAGPVALAQRYTIQGKVVEKQGDVLPSAAVFLLQVKDSAVVQYTSTNIEGQFFLRDIRKGDYIFKVSFLGFAPYFQNITTPPKTKILELGTIQLQPTVSELSEITVKAKVPVVVKGDTVEYDAGSFATRPNANVEQVLKKLPGVDLGRDGSIRVQGENVTRIFVDGKEFFGGNLQMATRNLPADAIDKVQVIDGKTEEALFSGIDDGRRQKVVNLTLKEDRRNTGFGKAMAGVGTAGRYVAQGNYNRMNDGNMVSVVGMSNNVNSQGLSSDGLSTGEASAGAGGGRPADGLVTTHMVGVNASNQLTGKTRVNGSYLLNYTDAQTLQQLTRQNFLPEGTALYYENSQGRNKNSLHNATFGLEHRDSLNTVRLNAGINYMEATMASNSHRESYSVENTLVNEGERSFVTRNKNIGLYADLFYGHRFRKAGRLFTVTNLLATAQDEAAGQSASVTRFSGGGEEALSQRNEQENQVKRI